MLQHSKGFFEFSNPMLSFPLVFKDSLDLMIISCRIGSLSLLTLETLDRLERINGAEHIKGSFAEDGLEFWKIGDVWICIREDKIIIELGLNEKDEQGQWISLAKYKG